MSAQDRRLSELVTTNHTALEQRGGSRSALPRLMHMADVHLGARHHDLGPAGRAARAPVRGLQARRRHRHHRACRAVLICGDLFDSNSQPRRSIERAAAELRRLTDRHVRVVIIPGTHDCYETGSIYRVFDLPALVSGKAERGSNDRCVVLTVERPMVSLPELRCHRPRPRVRDQEGAHQPAGRLEQTARADGNGTKLQIGMIHGARYVPGQVEQDDVIFTDEEVAASGLDYLALGHWHSFQQGRAGNTTWAYSGAPEPVQIDQDGAGQVLLVTLEPGAGKADVKVEARTVGRTRLQKLTIEGAEVGSQVGARSALA